MQDVAIARCRLGVELPGGSGATTFPKRVFVTTSLTYTEALETQPPVRARCVVL